MINISAFQERTQKIARTLWLKLRHPSVQISQCHLVRPDTEISLKKGGKLILGKNVSTYRRVALSAVGGTLRIGDGVCLNRNNTIVCFQSITIGSGCAFGPNVVVYDHDHKFSGKGFSMDTFQTSPVVIEDNCWIGANVTILRGTHIGQGSVIGAGTVVKGDIPPFSLVRSDRTLRVEPLRGE